MAVVGSLSFRRYFGRNLLNGETGLLTKQGKLYEGLFSENKYTGEESEDE